MRLLFITFIFILFCYSAEFVTDEIIKRVDEKYGLFAEKRFKSLQKLISELQGANDMKKLEEVNNFFNDVSYSSDKDTYGVTDYWATPLEFLSHGEGDCEDYAIAKYFLLTHLGIASNKMFITYVNVEGYSQAHMVLIYFDNPSAEPYILDNFKTELLSASQRTDLKPIYYFNPEILKDGMQTSAHRKWDQLIKNIMEKKI